MPYFVYKPAPDTPDEAELFNIHWKAGKPELIEDPYITICLQMHYPWRAFFEEVPEQAAAAADTPVKRGPGRPKKVVAEAPADPDPEAA